MPRVQPQNVSNKERVLLLDLLWTSIAELTSRDEVRAFFKDLLSETEAIMLARRIRIAQLILSGKSYVQIEKELKTSQSTIAGVQRWLTAGGQGYEVAIQRFEKVFAKTSREAKNKARQIEPYSFEWLRRRYPLHFLLFNLIEANLNQEE